MYCPWKKVVESPTFGESKTGWRRTAAIAVVPVQSTQHACITGHSNQVSMDKTLMYPVGLV
jgi:hypothetical protein